jgi:hypothetical protein
MKNPFSSDYLFNACEEIDAAIFSSDAFDNQGNRDALVDYIQRWMRAMKDPIPLEDLPPEQEDRIVAMESKITQLQTDVLQLQTTMSRLTNHRGGPRY